MLYKFKNVNADAMYTDVFKHRPIFLYRGRLRRIQLHEYHPNSCAVKFNMLQSGNYPSFLIDNSNVNPAQVAYRAQRRILRCRQMNFKLSLAFVNYMSFCCTLLLLFVPAITGLLAFFMCS